MIYLLLKVFHIVSMVAWFAGLFYLVRLFVYHSEAFSRNESEKDLLTGQYGRMASSLYKKICNPAMMLTWVLGIAMIAHNGMEWFGQNGWLHVKVLLAIILTVYHVYFKKIMKTLAQGQNKYSGLRLRLLNEVPTVFLVTIVILAVFKNEANILYVLGGMVLLAVIIYIAIKSSFKN